MNSALALIRFFALSALMAGCASTSVFNPYPGQAAEYKAAINNNTIQQVAADLGSKTESADRILYLSERGRLYQLNGDYEASKKDFAEVIAAYDAIEAKAAITASGAAAGTSSLLSNDNAIPYAGFGYERIFAHQFQAFNYLSLGDLEGANVEIRRAALEQRIMELAHEKDIAEAESAASAEGLDVGDWQNTPELSGMDSLAGNIKSSFQNAYTFYTSAVLWEAQGDFNSAVVDYKKALEINPQNQQIQQDVLRASAGTKLAADQSALVVLFEDGFVPDRQSFNLSIPYFTSGSVTYLSMAFPYYSADRWMPSNTLAVYGNQQKLGETEQVAHVGAMAVKALKEKVPGMIVRQVLRARTKYETHKAATEQGGLVGSLLSTVYNLVSEQADLRSWLTLPNNAQILRSELAAGEHAIELNAGGLSQTVNLTLRGGKITVLRVINVNNRLVIQTFNL
jgi:uncharacterized protein